MSWFNVLALSLALATGILWQINIVTLLQSCHVSVNRFENWFQFCGFSFTKTWYFIIITSMQWEDAIFVCCDIVMPINLYFFFFFWENVKTGLYGLVPHICCVILLLLFKKSFFIFKPKIINFAAKQNKNRFFENKKRFPCYCHYRNEMAMQYDVHIIWSMFNNSIMFFMFVEWVIENLLFNFTSIWLFLCLILSLVQLFCSSQASAHSIRSLLFVQNFVITFFKKRKKLTLNHFNCGLNRKINNSVSLTLH